MIAMNEGSNYRDPVSRLCFVHSAEIDVHSSDRRAPSLVIALRASALSRHSSSPRLRARGRLTELNAQNGSDTAAEIGLAARSRAGLTPSHFLSMMVHASRAAHLLAKCSGREGGKARDLTEPVPERMKKPAGAGPN